MPSFIELVQHHEKLDDVLACMTVEGEVKTLEELTEVRNAVDSMNHVIEVEHRTDGPMRVRVRPKFAHQDVKVVNMTDIPRQDRFIDEYHTS